MGGLDWVARVPPYSQPELRRIVRDPPFGSTVGMQASGERLNLLAVDTEREFHRVGVELASWLRSRSEREVTPLA
jgi:hypothetical protein